MSGFIKTATYLICNLTGLTNMVARFTGAGYFLPQLFRLRYANFGGINPELFGKQMQSCKSFDEEVWCNHWSGFAANHEQQARHLLEQNLPEEAWASQRKAIAYYSVSAFPGTTPKRLQSHAKAKSLFEEMIQILGDRWEKVVLPLEGEQVAGYLFLPDRAKRHPAVLFTNGLEGTAPEIMVSIIGREGEIRFAVFVMEMPGTYDYTAPLSTASSAIYSGVIDYLSTHENIDPDRIGMSGVSFGGHWSARMAALESRLKCAVVIGAPLLFDQAAIRPQIFIDALMKVSGARSLPQLIKSLKALSFNENNGELFDRIRIPLLVINGDNDTLIPTSDSIALAEEVPGATLKLYENDDHCAMGHYAEMIEFGESWILRQLAPEIADNQ